MTNEQIARMLGLKEVEYKETTSQVDEGELLWVNADESYNYGTIEEVAKWLDSAEGRQKIRDRVKELLKARGWAYEYRWWINTDDSECHALAVGPVRYNDDDDACLLPEGFLNEFTESAAWLAALEFLTKEIEK